MPSITSAQRVRADLQGDTSIVVWEQHGRAAPGRRRCRHDQHQGGGRRCRRQRARGRERADADRLSAARMGRVRRREPVAQQRACDPRRPRPGREARARGRHRVREHGRDGRIAGCRRAGDGACDRLVRQAHPGRGRPDRAAHRRGSPVRHLRPGAEPDLRPVQAALASPPPARGFCAHGQMAERRRLPGLAAVRRDGDRSQPRLSHLRARHHHARLVGRGAGRHGGRRLADGAARWRAAGGWARLAPMPPPRPACRAIASSRSAATTTSSARSRPMPCGRASCSAPPAPPRRS